MDNIERLQKLKELAELKAQLHKKNALGYLPWNQTTQDEETWDKVFQYGKIGYAIFQFVKNSNAEEQESA